MNAVTRIALPSHNIEIEQALLGAIMARPEVMTDCRHLEPKHFYASEHGAIWDICRQLDVDGKRPTPISVSGFLPSEMRLQGKTPSQYLVGLLSSTVGTKNVPDWTRLIVELWQFREIEALCENIKGTIRTRDPSTKGDALLAEMLGRVMEIDRETGGGARDITLADAAHSMLEKASKAYAGKVPAGYSTLLPFIEQLTGPWMAGQCILIGAATKIGKSSLAMQAAIGLAEHGKILYYGFEMTAELVAAREIAKATRISTLAQRAGTITKEQYEAMARAVEDMSALKNIIYRQRKMTAQEIADDVRRVRLANPDLMAVFVDHLGIVKSQGWSQADWERAAAAAPVMKEIAEENNVIVCACSQVLKDSPDNRASMKQRIAQATRKPTSDDLKGAIANDADHVIMPYRPEAQLEKIKPSEQSDDYAEWLGAESQFRGVAEIGLVLSRERPWPRWVPVVWSGESTSFLSANPKRGFL